MAIQLVPKVSSVYTIIKLRKLPRVRCNLPEMFLDSLGSLQPKFLKCTIPSDFMDLYILKSYYRLKKLLLHTILPFTVGPRIKNKDLLSCQLDHLPGQCRTDFMGYLIVC